MSPGSILFIMWEIALFANNAFLLQRLRLLAGLTTPIQTAIKETDKTKSESFFFQCSMLETSGNNKNVADRHHPIA